MPGISLSGWRVILQQLKAQKVPLQVHAAGMQEGRPLAGPGALNGRLGSLPHLGHVAAVNPDGRHAQPARSVVQAPRRSPFPIAW